MNITDSLNACIHQIEDKTALVAILTDDQHVMFQILFYLEHAGIRFVLLSTIEALHALCSAHPVKYILSDGTDPKIGIVDSVYPYLFYTGVEPSTALSADTHHCILDEDNRLLEVSTAIVTRTRNIIFPAVNQITSISYDQTLGRQIIADLHIMCIKNNWTLNVYNRSKEEVIPVDAVMINETGMLHALRAGATDETIRHCIYVTQTPMTNYHLSVLNHLFRHARKQVIYAVAGLDLPMFVYQTFAPQTTPKTQLTQLIQPIASALPEGIVRIITSAGDFALKGVPGYISVMLNADVVLTTQKALTGSDQSIHLLMPTEEVVKSILKQIFIAENIPLPTISLAKTGVISVNTGISESGLNQQKLDDLLERYRLNRLTVQISCCDESIGSKLSTDAISVTLRNIFIHILRTDDFSESDNLFLYNLTSVKILEAIVKLRKQNLVLTVQQVYENPSIAGMRSAIIQTGAAKPQAVMEVRSEVWFPDGHEQEKVKELCNQRIIEAVYPLTDVQVKAYAQLVHLTGSGNEFSILNFSIEGNLNLGRFELAWRRIFQKHSLLRVGFVRRGFTRPVQIIYRQIFPEIHYKNLAGKADGAFRKIWNSDLASQKLELEFPPLVKLYLYQLEEQKFRFFLKTPNPLFDGWSSAILLRDFVNLYTAVSDEEPQEDHYKNYMHWLVKTDAQAARSFWIKEFMGYHAFDAKEINVTLIQNISELVLTFSDQEHQYLLDIMNRLHLSPILLFLTAWAIIWGDAGASVDTFSSVVGMAFSGRSAPVSGILDAVGLFSNILPLNLKKSGESMLSWFQALQMKFFALQQFEFTPMHQIAEWNNLPQFCFEKLLYHQTIVYLDTPQQVDHNLPFTIQAEKEVGYTDVPLRLYIKSYQQHRCVLRYDLCQYTIEEIEEKLNLYRSVLFILLETLDNGEARKE